MTVPSSVAKSGPYICNGVTDVFNYDFRIVDKSHLNVILTDANGAGTSLALTTHYTVSDVGSDTGSINLTASGVALAITGTTLTILRNPPFTQETDLQNQGAYLAQTVEDRFDLLTMQIQTVKERSDRSIAIAASDEDTTLDDLTADLVKVAGIADDVSTVADHDADIGTVAGISADVTTVAGIANKIPDAANFVLKTATDASTFGFVLPDDDTLAEASATKLARSKNVKAYVDASIDAIVLPAVVADRTSLKAVDATKYSTAILTEGSSAKRGRFGRFLLGNYSDYSAAVTADTQEGFVIRSTSDATKVWIRDAPEACPEHFGAVADGATDDYTAISVGIAVADALAIPFKFYGSYAMGSSLAIPVTLRNIDAAPESKITGINSVVNGVTVGGAPTRFGKIVLPSIFSFPGIGLTAIGGIMDLYIPEIVSCGTGVRIADGGGGATVRANFIGNCTLAIEFYMSSTSAVIQGSSVRGGFITNTPNIVKFSGAAGACDGLIVEYDAIDVVTGGGVVFTNSLSVAIPRFTFKCPSWLGGNGFSAATKTQLFSGQWNNGDFDITNALAFDQSHMTPGQPAATRWKFRNQGSSGGFVLAGSLAAFNGGVMLCQTEFMVKTTLAADLAAGGAVTARFYHILADSNYYNWQMTKCAGPNGAVIGAYSDFNSTEAGRVDITILNAGTTTITAGSTIFIAVARN